MPPPPLFKTSFVFLSKFWRVNIFKADYLQCDLAPLQQNLFWQVSIDSHIRTQ